MSKRDRDMEKHCSDIKKRRPRIKLEDAPPINSIENLIEIGQSIKFYKNLDTIMLWRIAPYLEELNNLVGMKTLKESIFYQILYYIQGMHTRNQTDEYLHTILMGDPGCGKCLGKDTPILMYNGSIKMVQDVQPQDLIMGDDSTPRTVLSTCQGREVMYKVKQLYGVDYIVNESHILSLKLSKSPRIRYIPDRNRYSVVWYDKQGGHTKVFTYEKANQKEIEEKAIQFSNTLPQKGNVIDISVKDYLIKNKNWKAAYKGYKVGIDFDSTDVDIDPYILGYWLGDGTKDKPQITTCDEEVVEYFTKYFHDLVVRVNKTGITYDITSGKQGGIMKDRNRLISTLRKYNVWNNKHIPQVYLTNTRKIRLELLAGLLDSDGYLKANNVFEITQKNKTLVNDIVFLSRSLGFKVTISEVTKNCHYLGEIKSGKYQRIFISGNTEEIPVKIFRKQANTRKSNKDPLVYGITLQRLEEDDYYGFEIDGNRRFVLGDFTITHNTTVAQIIAKIYQGIGILNKNGPFKIAHRDDFVAGYLGQTALKTQKLLKSCLGGVLFIDEVYALGSGQEDKDSFSKEAIDTLTSFLSEHTNDFCCIAAGYEKDIQKCFFSVNSGLESRFQWKHTIDSYTSNDLAKIFSRKVKEINWELGIDLNVISKIIEKDKNLFENSGRDIINFITKCKMVHARRVIILSKEHKFVLTREDLENGIEMLKKNTKTLKQDPPPIGIYT